MTSHSRSPMNLRSLSPPGSPARGRGSRALTVTRHATSIPPHMLPTYSPRDHNHVIPNSPPAAPTTPNYRRPNVPHHSSTMPAGALPNPFGSPTTSELPPSYHVNPMSPSYASSMASPRHHQRSYSVSTPKSAGLRQTIPVNQRTHDDAVYRHRIPLNYQTSKFFFSSFEYVQNSYFPIHPAFSEWIHSAGPANLALIWREVEGNILLPVVIMYEYESKANIEAYRYGARLEYLHLSGDGQSFTREYMGDICVREEWHLLHKNKPLLMFAQPGNPRLLPVRGEMFKPKGDSKKYPSKAKPNIQLLTCSFVNDKTERTRWEVGHDGAISITAEAGDGANVGVITAEQSVHGFVISGPITFDPDTKHPELWKNGFLTHIVLALIVIPMYRPPNMTRLLGWLRTLGHLASED